MLSNRRPQTVNSRDDIQWIAGHMKGAAGLDDDPRCYSKTKEEVRNILRTISEEERKEILESGASRAIVLKHRIYSLSLTIDEEHGHDWHLSMCQILPENSPPDNIDYPNKDGADVICEAFFSEYKPIDNPGKMKISHFVGND